MNDRSSFTSLTSTLGITNVINSYLRTGDPILDMIMITFIGILVTNLTTGMNNFSGNIFSSIKNIIKWIVDYLKIKINGKENIITIEYKLREPDPKINNKLLIDAILYNFKEASKYKIENKEVNKNFCNEFERESDRFLVLKVDEKFEEDGIIIEFQSLSKKIKKVANSRSRSLNRADDDDVIEDDVPHLEKIILRSRKPIKKINEFIKEKRDQYIKDFCSRENSLNIYPVSTYGAGYIEFSQITYRSKKSFKNWFFPGKEKINKMVKNFNDQSGIYSVPSIQNKLGILLHGEPGCGKTSFIKALANEMDRSIIPIFLDKFSNVQTLKDLFYNDYIYVRGRYSYGEWKYLPINRRIIVFEEIDTAGTIVMDRNKLKNILKSKRQKDAEPTVFNKYEFFQNMVSEYNDAKKGAKKSKKKRKNKKRNKRRNIIELNGNDSECSIQIIDSEELRDNEDDISDVSDNESNTDSEFSLETDFDDGIDNDLFDKSTKHKSGITLGDLLDLLDGICELDGLVYVITTNHKDYLDPALIRPGRINIDIELKKIRFNEIREMLSYYYITHNCYHTNITNDDKLKMIDKIARELDGLKKPSKLEEMCRNNNLEELFNQVVNCSKKENTL